MNSKILLSGATAAAAAALIIGATFAYFSSTATSTGNVFGSGTLVLQLDDENESTPASTITASFGGTLAPGGSTSGFISMHNGGSIDIAEVNLSATETATSSPDLAGKLNITSAKIGTESTCATSPIDITVSGGFTTLAALNSTGIDLPSTPIAASATKYLCMTFTLDLETDNTYQGKSITETFTFVGHQVLSQ
jgi:predicted ribosomally synthesized peptide with SipW-like signal peptide